MQQRFLFTGDDRADWRIDEHTRSVGRQGVATARATLAACQQAAADAFAPAA